MTPTTPVPQRGAFASFVLLLVSMMLSGQALTSNGDLGPSQEAYPYSTTTWTFQDTLFAPGFFISGSFTYDNKTERLSDMNVVSTYQGDDYVTNIPGAVRNDANPTLFVRGFTANEVGQIGFFVEGPFPDRPETGVPLILENIFVGVGVCKTVEDGLCNDIGQFDEGLAILTGVAPSGPVNLSGNIETVVVGQGAKIEPVCAMALASGEFMFSCDPIGEFSLENLPREADGSVVRQIYADGFFPSVTTLTESGVETVTLDRAFNCPSYNLPSNPDVIPASAGKMHSIAGRVLLQATDTPICALVLVNGEYMFSCDEEGTYSLEFPLDANGQYKLQVYADGFAPAVQTFNEFDDPLNVRMARSSECEADTSVTLYSKRFGFSESFNKAPFPYALTASLSGAYSGIPTPTTASLGIFKLLALGQNFTISNLSATDSSGRVSPYFTVLSNGYDLADGEEVEFELVSPLTRGATVNLNFQYEIQETGDTFSSSYIFSSN